jgi:hypothetical protein
LSTSAWASSASRKRSRKLLGRSPRKLRSGSPASGETAGESHVEQALFFFLDAVRLLRELVRVALGGAERRHLDAAVGKLANPRERGVLAAPLVHVHQEDAIELEARTDEFL